jgi:hypothetical protein
MPGTDTGTDAGNGRPSSPLLLLLPGSRHWQETALKPIRRSTIPRNQGMRNC